MVNVRHLWRWPHPIIAAHLARDYYYLAWCRGARVGTPNGTGVGGGGVFPHGSFFVPLGGGGNAWGTYSNVVAAINLALGAGNYRIGTAGGAIAGPGVALPPAAIVLPGIPIPAGGGAGRTYIYVNIDGAGITGIKYNLNAGGLGVVAGGAFPVPTAEAAATIPIVAATAAAVVAGVAAPGALTFAGGAAPATAIAPQPVSTVVIQIDAGGGGAARVSIYPI
jgi:hypothetical protein